MPTRPRLRDGIPEPWASEWGEDRHGLFMGFSIAGVIQRLRYIPPGEFLMGSPPSEIGRYDDEEQHLVRIAEGFWLADTPCTQALWQAVMGENPSEFKDSKRPVEKVNWDDCQVFLRQLNEQVPGLSARLPSEAEWEYACRAGTTTATWAGDLESEEFSSVLGRIAWYGSNSDFRTQPVRGKAVNPWGLYDMLGNVWEWCLDVYHPDRRTESRSYFTAPNEGWARVIRGGSWYELTRLRAGRRVGIQPDRRVPFFGFRLAQG